MSRGGGTGNQFAEAVELQRSDHAQREYEARRKHAYDLERQHNQQERQRIERVVYFAGAIPLTSLTLSNLDQFPAVMMIVALGLSVFAYGFWFINEFYGTTWRVETAHAEADLWFRFADMKEQAEKARTLRMSADDASHNADLTAKYVALYVWASFAASLFALIDQFVDINALATPNISDVLLIGAGAGLVSLVFWLKEFHKIMKIGSAA